MDLIVHELYVYLYPRSSEHGVYPTTLSLFEPVNSSRLMWSGNLVACLLAEILYLRSSLMLVITQKDRSTCPILC